MVMVSQLILITPPNLISDEPLHPDILLLSFRLPAFVFAPPPSAWPTQVQFLSRPEIPHLAFNCPPDYTIATTIQNIYTIYRIYTIYYIRVIVTVYTFMCTCQHLIPSSQIIPSLYLCFWLVLHHQSIKHLKVKGCSELLRKFIQIDKHGLPLVVALNPNLFGPDEHWGPKTKDRKDPRT